MSFLLSIFKNNTITPSIDWFVNAYRKYLDLLRQGTEL